MLIRQLFLRLRLRLGWRPAIPADDAIGFLVLVPTVRRGLIEDAMRRLMETFTYPTDFLLMDGSVGKAQALNECMRQTLNPRRHTFYVTLDDDIGMPPNWQDTVVEAYRKFRNLGAVGLDYEHTELGFNYTNGRQAEALEHGIRTRAVNVNLPGGNIIAHSLYALAVGPIPILPKIKYAFHEDGWRSKKFGQLGLENRYIIGDAPVDLLVYDDKPEYVTFKLGELEAGRRIKRDKLRWLGIRFMQIVFPWTYQN